MWHLLCVSTVMPPPGPSSTVQFFKTVRPLPLSTRHGERFAGLSTGFVLRRIVLELDELALGPDARRVGVEARAGHAYNRELVVEHEAVVLVGASDRRTVLARDPRALLGRARRGLLPQVAPHGNYDGSAGARRDRRDTSKMFSPKPLTEPWLENCSLMAASSVDSVTTNTGASLRRVSSAGATL